MTIDRTVRISFTQLKIKRRRSLNPRVFANDTFTYCRTPWGCHVLMNMSLVLGKQKLDFFVLFRIIKKYYAFLYERNFRTIIRISFKLPLCVWGLS